MTHEGDLEEFLNSAALADTDFTAGQCSARPNYNTGWSRNLTSLHACCINREDQCQSHLDPLHPQLEEPLPAERPGIASPLEKAERAERRTTSTSKIRVGRDDDEGRVGEE